MTTKRDARSMAISDGDGSSSDDSSDDEDELEEVPGLYAAVPAAGEGS